MTSELTIPTNSDNSDNSDKQKDIIKRSLKISEDMRRARIEGRR